MIIGWILFNCLLGTSLSDRTRQHHFKSSSHSFNNQVNHRVKSSVSFETKVEEAVKLVEGGLIQSQLNEESSDDEGRRQYRDIILDLMEEAPITTLGEEGPNALLKKRLLKFSEDSEPEWLSPIDAQFRRLKTKANYVDVTDLELHPTTKTKFEIPKEPSQQKLVKELISKIDTKNSEEFLKTYTQFYNRYYKSQYGVKASNHVYDTLNNMITNHTRVSIKKFSHSWPQNSIIAHIKGSDPSQTVVVGCHLDSINQYIPWFGRAPGADDNGSGTSTNIEVFRVLMESDYIPRYNLEFHWYAAEELGLLGSQAVSQAYARQQIPVRAMMQIDMDGHFATKREKIAIVEDFTDPELTSLLRNLIDTYTGLPWVNSKCGYGCSDHASWFQQGFRSAFPIEDPDIESNPNIHGFGDTVDTINFHHINQFTHLSLAFAVELSS